MSHTIDYDPSSYEEATNQQAGTNSMMEEYQSIMKNDVWDVFLRPEGKFVVNSKWMYKIKHAVDGNIKKSPAMNTNTIGKNTRMNETVGHNLTSHQFSGVSIMVLMMQWMELYIYLMKMKENKN